MSVSLDPRRLLARPALYRLFRRAVFGGAGREAFRTEHLRAGPTWRVLDIGCGPGDLLDDLPEGTDYTGLDASERYIAEARRRFGGRGEFRCERAGEASLEEPESYDLAVAIGVIHHLDDAEALALLRLAHRALRPGGRFLAMDPCLCEGQSPLARWIIRRDRGEHVREEAGYRALAVRVFPDHRARLRHDLLRIPYTHLFLDCTKPPGAEPAR